MYVQVEMRHWLELVTPKKLLPRKPEFLLGKHGLKMVTSYKSVDSAFFCYLCSPAEK